MSFVTYYLFDKNKFFKCCADESYKQFFLNLGAVLTEEEEKDKCSGDAGSGSPNSSEWHINKIIELDTKQEVLDYMAMLGVEFNKRGGLDSVKDKALVAIGEIYD